MYQSGNILYLVFVDHLAFNPANVFWGTLADCRQAAKQIVADQAVSLRAMGLSYEEIALETKTELGTVKSRISRARTKLENILHPYFYGEDSRAA